MELNIWLSLSYIYTKSEEKNYICKCMYSNKIIQTEVHVHTL